MSPRRGLQRLALATLLVSGCDKTLSFDPPVEGANGGETSSGTAGSGGFAGSLVGDAGGPDEPWLRAGGPGKDPPPSTGGTGAFGNEDCQSFCFELGQRCLDPVQKCVECLQHEDCEPLGLHCDRGVNRCVPCVDNDDCEAGQGCDGKSGQCLGRCAQEDHPERVCSDAPQMCDEERKVCITCRGDEDCMDSPDGAHCLQGGARCAECVGDGDCRKGATHCDPVLFQCVECRDSRDCELPTVCHPEAHVCANPLLPWPFPEAQ